jgi:hypothetical protein
MAFMYALAIASYLTGLALAHSKLQLIKITGVAVNALIMT